MLPQLQGGSEFAKMRVMDKTVKIRAYSGDTPSAPVAAELPKGQATADESRKVIQEQSQIIEQLRESLRIEQTRTVEMVRKKTELETRVKELSATDSRELVQKTAQFEEEKNKSLELLKTVAQLRESLKQEQAQAGEMAVKYAAQETRLKELSDVLGKISSAVAAVKAG